MARVFDFDSRLYKICNTIYYLLMANLMWFLFSIPLFTIGASTTSLYYVIGKLVRNEEGAVSRDFVKSFKLNFKQATIIWLILVAAFCIVYISIKSNPLLGSLGKYLYPFQMIVFLELVFVLIYIFPMLSRYNMKIKALFLNSFILGNKSIFSSIACIVSFAIITLMLYKISGALIIIFFSFYALVSYQIIHRIFMRYLEK